MEALSLPFKPSVFAPLRPSQLTDFRDAWMYFQYVGLYNYNVQQIRLSVPDAAVSYFRFPSNEDRLRYNLGLELYLRAYPEYKYNLRAIVPEEL